MRKRHVRYTEVDRTKVPVYVVRPGVELNRWQQWGIKRVLSNEPNVFDTGSLILILGIVTVPFMATGDGLLGVFLAACATVTTGVAFVGVPSVAVSRGRRLKDAGVVLPWPAGSVAADRLLRCYEYADDLGPETRVYVREKIDEQLWVLARAYENMKRVTSMDVDRLNDNDRVAWERVCQVQVDLLKSLDEAAQALEVETYDAARVCRSMNYADVDQKTIRDSLALSAALAEEFDCDTPRVIKAYREKIISLTNNPV